MLRLTRAQVREIDRRAIEEYHIPGVVLMENAARSVAAVAMQMSRAQKSAVIVCGGGNNGGDGLAVARHLHNNAWPVEIILASEKAYAGDALIQYQIVQAMGIATKRFATVKDPPNPHAHVLVIDALFGTGLQSPPRSSHALLIRSMNECGLPILSVDVPSGIDCDTGVPLGDACVRATRTVTFVAEKAGFAEPAARQYTGDIVVGDIGVPRRLIEEVARMSG
jgi:NAD(P)H-hydrate epimerase